MGFSSRLAVAAWAVGLATAALGLSLGGCAREPGDPLPETRIAVNASDLASWPYCVDRCEPDYGSAPVDCVAAEAGLEFFPAPVWDFDSTVTTRTCEDGSPVTRPIARNLYLYGDETDTFSISDTCECEGPTCDQNRYEPNTEPIERCGRLTNALHVRGGPFREWGGGVGRRLQDFASQAAAAVGSSCPIPPPPEQDPATPSFCPKADQRVDTAPGRTLIDGQIQPMNRGQYYSMVVDLREWDGISFWARRGPDGQGGFRVALGDRNLDDDVSFLEFEGGLAPLCGRVLQCECRQQDKHCLPMNPAFPERTWCWDPAVDEVPIDPDALYDRCGDWACDEAYPAFTRTDLAFSTAKNDSPAYRGTNSCQHYAFATDQTGDYCYDPVHGPPPPEGTERCGDTFLDPVPLGPDWQFYRIPFAELRQEGWAKRFPRLDLAAVTMVRFTWSVGWIDLWLDDVRFYRRKK